MAAGTYKYGMYSHTCGQLRASDIGSDVVICG